MSTRNALPPVFVNNRRFYWFSSMVGEGAELNVRRTLHKLRRKIVRLNMYVSVHSIVTGCKRERRKKKK